MTAVVGLGFQASPGHVPFVVFQGILLCSLERKETPDTVSEECKPLHTVYVQQLVPCTVQVWCIQALRLTTHDIIVKCKWEAGG